MSDDHIDYASWGVGFFRTAVSAERVLAGVNVLAGQPIDVGPMGVGPGKMVKLRATGAIGEAVGSRVSDEPVSFHLQLPVSLEFEIDVALAPQRFVAEIVVPLLLTARARADLAIVLDVTPPAAHEVLVRMKALGLRASITQHAANIEGELRSFIASYVARELDKPHVQQVLTIDVTGSIDKALAALGSHRPKGEEMASDLPTALEDDLRRHEDLFTDESVVVAD